MVTLDQVNTSDHGGQIQIGQLFGEDPLVSDHVLRIGQWIVYGVACQIVDILGTITNIINIICFVKQGFKDSVNVSLMGLAISDLGCLATLIFTNLCFTPAFQESDLPFDSAQMQFLTTGWPHIICSRVTSCITAFITLERCLCITIPLKVKTIITPRRVFFIIVSLFVVLILSVFPVYSVTGYGYSFSPMRNKTILGLVFAPNRENVEKWSYAINNLVVPFSAFAIVIVCTTVLVVNLRLKAKWREKSTQAGQARLISNRDQKVTKMVVVISALFIACFIPICALFMATLTVSGLSIDGRYRKLTTIVIGIGFFLESLNSATNMFIYYRLSTKYRAVLRQLFRLGPENEHLPAKAKLSSC